MKDKVVLITGASTGIGLACAKLALVEGAHAVFYSGKKEQHKDQIGNMLSDQCYYLPLDVRSESAWEKVIAEIKSHFGRLDVLINNAAITGTGLKEKALGLEETSLNSWKEVLNTNLDAVFLGCKIAFPLLSLSQSASIVNIGSRSGLKGRHDRMAYGASKAALINLSRSLAIYAAEKGAPIRCNCVLPSTIHTDAWNFLAEESEDLISSEMNSIAEKIPLRRFGTPLEVAKAVLFLASDDASYINGTELLIDGGSSALDCLRNDTF